MTSDPIFTAAILAGGRGRRLGGVDKSALLVGTRSILDRQVALLRSLTPHIMIVTSDPSRAPAGDIRVVTDRVAGAGALGGLYTALVEAATEQVLVIGCDMPFLEARFLTYLAERGRDVDAAVPRDARGRHPLCASYARRIADHLHARLGAGQFGVGDALAEIAVREVGPDELAPFNADGRLLTNINTPDDYARALKSVPHGIPDRNQDPNR
jgi:molybdopterin-guanine dinucleotide biosynthesis protein A